LAERTDQILDNPDWGGALYRADTGGMKCVISFGGAGADLPTRFPPSHYGDLVLSDYVMPEPVQQQMVSPLPKHEPPPQIPDRPRRGESETLYPDVQIETRQSREPRPQSDPTRYLLPGREEEPEARPVNLKWW
jgi:hypothetical protein